MSTRKIKNARDLKTDELIYFKSHAQATFMSDGSTVEDTINDIKENGGGADLSNYVTTTQLNTSLSGKQDTISDLADIRSGASKGATAVQPGSLSTVATSGSYTDLSNKPTIATAVTINGVNKTISSNKINIGTIPTAVTINGSTKTGSTIALGTVVTGVTMNGSAKTVSNGKVDLGTIITAHQTLKTINGQSIVGSGDITISGGGDYLPLTGGTITGDLTLTGGTGGLGNFQARTVTSPEVFSNLYYLNSDGDYAIKMGYNEVEIIDGVERTKASIDWGGDGTKFLSDDGTYKTISGGSGSSDANVQAVETGDVLDDVNVDYATSAYVDGLVGDINSVLDNIIDGSGSNNSQKYILWDDSYLHFEGGDNAVPNVKYICTVPIVSLEFGVMVSPADCWHGGITEPYSEYTFIFTSGDECSITTGNDIKWANGTAPTIEPGVRYELSISLMYINNEYIGHAVLVPFKTV